MKKTPSNDLYLLVNKLSKAEKRYISIYLSNSVLKNKSQGLKLFKLIHESTENSVVEFEKELTWAKNLSKLKHDLFQTILKQLELFYANSSDTIIVRRKINQVEILFNRGLYSYCEKLIVKTLKEAEKNENYTAVHELSSWLLKVKMYFEIKNNEAFNKILTKGENALNIVVFENKLISIKNSMYLYNKTQGKSQSNKKAINQKFKELKKISEKELPSFFSKFTLYLSLHHYYFRYNKDLKKTFENIRKLVKLFEENEIFSKRMSSSYITALNNYALSAINMKKYTIAKTTFIQMKELPLKKKNDQLYLFGLWSANYMHFLCHIGDIKEALKMEEFIHKGWKKYGETLGDVFKLVAASNMVNILFLSGNYKKALIYINIILEMRVSNVRKDILRMIVIANILVHYELGNSALVWSLFTSYRKKLNKKEIGFEFEKWFSHFFSILINSTQDKSFFKMEENKLLSNINHEDFVMFDEFNLLVYLRRKHENVSLEDSLLLFNEKSVKEYKQKRLSALLA